MNKEILDSLLVLIEESFNDVKWKYVKIASNVNNGSLNFQTTFFDETKNKEIDRYIRIFKLTFLGLEIRRLYNEKVNTSSRFNKVLIEINKDGSIEEKYSWDESKNMQERLEFAKIYHGWLIERIMPLLFKYNLENNLVPHFIDDDGDKQYLPSWDDGIFSFLIKNEEVEWEIRLTKDGKERILDIPLPNYIIESILDHYQFTNNELTKEWKPWNKMVIDSPFNGIILNLDKHIKYTLEK